MYPNIPPEKEVSKFHSSTAKALYTTIHSSHRVPYRVMRSHPEKDSTLTSGYYILVHPDFSPQTSAGRVILCIIENSHRARSQSIVRTDGFVVDAVLSNSERARSMTGTACDDGFELTEKALNNNKNDNNVGGENSSVPWAVSQLSVRSMHFDAWVRLELIPATRTLREGEQKRERERDREGTGEPVWKVGRFGYFVLGEASSSLAADFPSGVHVGVRMCPSVVCLFG